MRIRRSTQAASRAGYSALELAFSVTIFVVVLLSSLAMVDRDTHLARSALGIGTIESMAQEMLFELERELVNGLAKDTRTDVVGGLAPGSTALTVGSTRGYPPEGTLVVDRDNGSREIIRYGDFGAASFSELERGLDCTTDVGHNDGAQVIWSGWATVPPNAPPPGTPQAMELGGPVFYQGDGTGFAFQVPVDPSDPLNGTNYLDGDNIEWGAVLDGQPAKSCDMALYFQPRTVVTEATTGDDLNNDGDTADAFDLGQIRRITWNFDDSSAPTFDVGLGPSAVLQERCNYGGDLDGDGFGDPIFLWNEENRQLHIRVFVVGQSVLDMPVVREVESVIFLRNNQDEVAN